MSRRRGPQDVNLNDLRLLTAVKAAEILGLSVGTLRRLVRAGRLRARKRTEKGRLVFTAKDLADYVESLPLAAEPAVMLTLPDEPQPRRRRRDGSLPKGFITFV